MKEGHTRKLPVPDVEGLPVDVARKVVVGAGFGDVQVRYVESYETKGTVVGQSPQRGSLHDEDGPVVLVVAGTSLIRYLPSVYQPKRPGERSFLRDFLWIIQHLHDGVSRRLDHMDELFSPYRVPVHYLPWLASWFGIAFDDDMDEAGRRRLLKEAASLFRLRGTREAIVRMVKLFTGLDVEIVENQWPYKGLRVGDSSRIGVDTMVLPSMPTSHTFVVKVPVGSGDLDQETLVRLHRVIEAEKPAHTNYFLQFADREGVTEDSGLMRVGMGFAIGVGAVDTGADAGEEATNG